MNPTSDKRFRAAVLTWMKSRPPFASAVLGWLSIAAWPVWFALFLFYTIGRFLWLTDIQVAQTDAENRADQQPPVGS